MSTRFAALAAGIALAVLASTAAYAQDAGTTQGGTSSATNVDQNFVTAAVRANDEEVDQAQAQLNVNGSSAVRMYAQRIIDDHTTANSQLAAIAKSLNLTFPQSHIAQSSLNGDATPPPAATRPNPMTPLTPQAYMAQQVQAHQTAIALYEGEVKNGGSEQLRTYAAQTLPALKAHLTMAQQYVSSGTISPVATPTPAGQR
ncbi:MAG: DUF4142 domain-containing protein [Candidatus Eremiobacteraeota bacterium]|nr:DUF4142 domain-containing protein [Candidatus Eremiobacteraeota bacterium]MBV8372048.1 DUF4142 domain-containing protein [Candidatus Eremiobacteraeota bacterium]